MDRTLFAITFALTASGCAGFSMGNKPGLVDARQDCVEGSLRRAPDPGVLPEAATEFDAACSDGQAAACSVLGVMYQLGRGVDRDDERAHALFAGACAAGNAGGCVNLGSMLVADGDVVTASVRFQWGCDHGEKRGCAELATLHAQGVGGIPLDLPRAATLYEIACHAGDGTACFRAASLREYGPLAQNPLLVITLYEQACATGVADACERLPKR
jgi:uncharacterized protein